ncbi:MAG: tyrosine-type recombinase/integrase [Shinella sp.]|nr:tyrosine-type recombinase/integrase [Shinella sp.]
MATVHYPKYPPKNAARYKSALRTPYVLAACGDYPDGINAYIYERGNGGPSSGVNRVRLRPKSLRAVAERVCNFLTFLETDEAHPASPSLNWRDVKEWHVTHLYENAQTLGVWSQEYFLTGVASPLEPETVEDRVIEILRCYRWLEENGYISGFQDEGSLSALEHAYRPISGQRRNAVQRDPNEPEDKAFTPRQSTGQLIPPSRNQFHQFIEALTPGTHRTVALLIYETGLRLSEVVENTLLPGIIHCRNPDATFHLPSFPAEPYLLSWSANDDRMIGVLPDRQQAWDETARSTTDCSYRIVGKGLVIRRIDIPARLMQALWHYVEGPRRAILRANGISLHNQPAQLFLDRYGKPLSAHAIQDAFRRVNKKIKCGYRFTAHALRHMFACDFLHSAVLARARLFGHIGHNSGELTFDLLERHGDFVVTVLQRRLGHKFRDTTLVYLEQLKLSLAGLDHTTTWNEFLDD